MSKAGPGALSRARRLVAARRFRLASPVTALAAGGLALVLMLAEFPLSGLAHQNVNAGGGSAPIWVSAPFVAVGAVLAARKPRNPLGWLFLGFGGFGALAEDASFYVVASYRLRPAPLPFAWVALLAQPTWSVVIVLLGLAVLLFPDGHLPSPRLRWLLRVFLAVGTVWMASTFILTISAITRHDIHVDYAGNLRVLSHATGWLAVVQGVALIVLIGSAAVSLASQIVSYRRSSGERRQQLKWLLRGSCVTVVLLLLSGVLGSGPGLLGALSHVLNVLAIFALPVSMGVAILKYRLYDIDRIISRTLAYTIVTSLLVGVYAALALLGTEVFRFRTPVAVAASTLAAAALFAPVHRRVQLRVDRRFNRARYDADQTVAAFAARLKDAVDLDSVCDDLTAAVQHALEPAHLSVWIRAAERK
jgi:hypothetical protein